MDELKQRLTKELQHDFNVKIMDSLSWRLPVHSIEIAYHTVKRTKMDILMKMMLIAFGKAEIETAEELSEILLVEPLFINDLIDKMVRTGLIEKDGGSFVLTKAGVQQLEDGIFEHNPENHTKTMNYSPCHQSFLNGKIAEATDEEKEVYRFKNEFDDWAVRSIEETVFINALKTTGIESSDGNVQVVVSEILTATDLEINFIPCMEFRLYHTEEDIIYARVWNTLTEQWDETLEAQLNERERKVWRETYFS